MMLPGGSANKLGNRYEKWWTVSQLVRMLSGEADTIRIEDPDSEKAEFVLTVGSWRELHQVKRASSTGKWTLAALDRDRLLQKIGEQLANNSDRFVLASGSDARDLSELRDAATSAKSTEEFERRFLAAEGRNQRFKKLLRCWECDVTTAVERLRRIDIRTIGERELEQKVEWGVKAHFITSHRAVLAALWRIVEDSVHRTITRQDLVEELGMRGHQLRRLIKPEHAGVAVRAVTDRYLEGVRRKFIRQRLVPRMATQMILSRLDGDRTDSVITGRAGVGKTACAAEIVSTARERGLPVLAFRLDRFLAMSTTHHLGHSLDLEESPVFVLAAAAEAAGKPGVLIVDQLDAVSTVSGRSSGAFDLVEQLLQEARGTRGPVTVHTVVVCRAFDWEHDARLRNLMSRGNSPIEVIEFSADEVKTILAGADFDLGLFRGRQLELLRLPQNLSLFLDAGFSTSHKPAFGSATDLFDQYWKEKRRSVAARVAPLPDHWMDVVETLCEEMTTAQRLSVSRESLDKIPPAYLEQLGSEGVITVTGRRYGFGHESFFDYCFARLFIRQSRSLVRFLKASEQHLFRRAQVRQALAYLRDAGPDRYVRELGGLLADDGIRTHIKDLVFAFLADVMEPTEQEWDIWKVRIAPAIRAIKDGSPNSDRLSELAWRRFAGSRSWFVDASQRLIEAWLSSDNERLAEMAVSYLTGHQRHSPDHVAAMLEPYADHGGKWAQRLRSLVARAQHHTSRRFFDFVLSLVANGTLDAADGMFWSMFYALGESRPEWVPEVLAHYLRRRLPVLRGAGKGVHGRAVIIGDDDSAARLFAKSAAGAPAEFVRHVLAPVLEIADLALDDDEPPKRDAVWPIFIEKEHPRGDDACILGLASALASVGSQDTAELRDVVADLRRRDTYIANHLLLALYGGAPRQYADEAASLLCDEPWRFQCGFADNPNWCSMELIRAIVPQCATSNLMRLEAVIISYLSPFERTVDGFKYKLMGRTRFNLLSAIPKELRSPRANSHFCELGRKFGRPDGKPRGVTGGLVESPIDQSAAEKMTDQQWLRAIDKYRPEDRQFFSGYPFKGGALELSRVLKTRVEEDPSRFARLSLRFYDDANPHYIEHVLMGLKDAEVSSDLKIQVCGKAFAEMPAHCGAAIADVLGAIEDHLPDHAIRMLDWLATEHDDPVREAWREDAGGGQTYYNGEIHTHGINTTRGRAAVAVQALIHRDAAYVTRFRPTIEKMIRDRSAAVLSCVAGALRAVASHDPILGVSLFLRMNLNEERLLATLHVTGMINGNLRHRFSELRPLVERMIRSAEPEVREAGARMVSLAALEKQSVSELEDEVLHGDAGHRLGVAQVASANIAMSECRTWCKAKIAVLFNDSDARVRREAASCFSRLTDEALDTYGDLIEAFCGSTAFENGSFWLINALEKSVGRLPGMTCMVCERYLERGAGETFDVAKLIFRTYQQHQNDEWTERSLDLIDRLCLEWHLGAGHELEQFDR